MMQARHLIDSISLNSDNNTLKMKKIKINNLKFSHKNDELILLSSYVQNKYPPQLIGKTG
jgi:hypothetical protein